MIPLLLTLLTLKVAPNVGFAPLQVVAKIHVASVEAGEVCIVSWEGSSCFPIGEGKPLIYERKYTLRETTQFQAVMSYWDQKEKKWKKAESPITTVEVVPQ